MTKPSRPRAAVGLQRPNRERRQRAGDSSILRRVLMHAEEDAIKNAPDTEQDPRELARAQLIVDEFAATSVPCWQKEPPKLKENEWAMAWFDGGPFVCSRELKVSTPDAWWSEPILPPKTRKR